MTCFCCGVRMRWVSQIVVGDRLLGVLLQCYNCRRIEVVSVDEAREEAFG